MNSLTKTVLHRPVATLVIIVALIVFGISSVFGMKLQLTPDMDMPVMLVMTTYSGAAPEDVEELVSKEIEDACGTLSGLDTVYSYSMENMSMVMFSFEYGTDMDDTFIDMQSAIERVKSDLPDDANDPTIIEMDMNASDVMTLSVDAVEEGANAATYVTEIVEDELDKLSDVADLTISGDDEEYISVQLIPELVKQYGLSISSIASSIASANFTIPAGDAEYGSTQNLNVSAKMEYKTPAQIATIPLTTASGDLIHVSDVANVSYAVTERETYSRYNGADNISIGISKVQSSTAVDVSNAVTKVIEQLNAENPDYVISVTYDSSETILDSLWSVGQTLLLGVIITMIVLFIFFGDLKGSLIVATSMPLSVLMALLLMSFCGFSLNLMTLGALVIAIGMIVDNSSVVIEMCFRKQDEGLSFMDAAYEATKMVSMSLVASTATTVVVYLPLALMEGLSGQLFKQLGFTIIFAMAASLFSAITVVPLCFATYRPTEKKDTPVDRILDYIRNGYSRVLRWVLHKRAFVVLVSIGLLVLAIFMAQFLNVELMSSTDEGEVAVDVSFRPGVKLDVIDTKVREIEDFIAESPYIDDYSTTVDESDAAGSITASLSDDCKLETQEVVDEWTAALSSYADNCEITVSSSSSLGMSSMSSAGSYEISLESSDLDTLKEGCITVSSEIAKVNGVTSVSSSMEDAASKAEIVIDPIKSVASGLTPSTVSSTIYAMLSGTDAMDVSIDDQDYTVTVEYPKDQYVTMNDVYGITLTNTSGQDVPLSDIADLVYTDSPTTIRRQDGSYRGTVTANMSAADQFTVQAAIQEKMAGIFLPDGVEQVTNSIDEMRNEEFGSLGNAILSAIFLVFVVMAVEFESLRYSGMVMVCIPFSLIGVVALLLIANCTVSMVSLMGFLSLIGVVVNNGILFVDYANQMRATMSVEDALVETGRSRLRPILITTLTTILSMIPMGLGLGSNGQMTQGMALVVIGGLTASTILTLILLPTLYLMIDGGDKGERRRMARAEKKAAKQAQKDARREAKEEAKSRKRNQNLGKL